MIVRPAADLLAVDGNNGSGFLRLQKCQQIGQLRRVRSSAKPSGISETVDGRIDTIFLRGMAHSIPWGH
jgi:hypothetical protein